MNPWLSSFPYADGYYWMLDPENEELEVVEYDEDTPGFIHIIGDDEPTSFKSLAGLDLLFQEIPYPEY